MRTAAQATQPLRAPVCSGENGRVQAEGILLRYADCRHLGAPGAVLESPRVPGAHAENCCPGEMIPNPPKGKGAADFV